MRKLYPMPSLKIALFIVPLLGGCGNNGGGGVVLPKDGLNFPDCPEGSLFNVDANGMPQCFSPPPGVFAPPTCKLGEALTYDGTMVKCIGVNNGMTSDPTVITRIDKVKVNIMKLQNDVTDLQARTSGQALFVGVSTAATVGRISDGTNFGLIAAANLCAKDYGAGAHECTVMEMYDSAVNGMNKFSQIMPPTRAWVYMEGWNNPDGASTAGQEPTAGMNENCGSHTYPTHDQRWVGVAVQWAKVTSTSQLGLKFYSGGNTGDPTDVRCSSSLKIACCK